MIRRSQKPISSAPRDGVVLIVVLIAVMLLALAAWVYTGTMQVEYDASMMQRRDAQARLSAESAIEVAAVRIAQRATDDTVDLYHDPDFFRGVIVADDGSARGRLRYSVVSPIEHDIAAASVRFGLVNECSKLNVNSLLILDEDPDVDIYEVLMQLPGMTDEIIDCTLDWIDSDDDPRPLGAETTAYTEYAIRNGPMESLDEMLKVYGVTPGLLYGEDANRNGMLDPNENDGSDTMPADNGDGILDTGWSGLLTVYGREVNLQADGSARININQALMTELYDALEPDFGEEVAKFVVAYRLYGSDTADMATSESLTADQTEVAEAVGKVVAGDVDGTVTRGGLDLTQVAAFSFRSIYDLIDAEVTGDIDGAVTTLSSPWSSGSAALLSDFPTLEDMLTVSEDAIIEGRIDLNSAPREVLMTIPMMTDSAADAIIRSRPVITSDVGTSSTLERRRTAAWILADGLVDLETLRWMGPFITVRGDVFRLQTIGHFDEGGPVHRLEAVIDATQDPPRVRFVRDLSPLGRGVPNWILVPGE